MLFALLTQLVVYSIIMFLRVQELALLHHSRRTATVVSQDTVQLLTIGREDFFNIIIGQHRHGEISDHAKFIRLNIYV